MALDRSTYRYGTGAFFGKKDRGKGWETCTPDELAELQLELGGQGVSGFAAPSYETLLLNKLEEQTQVLKGIRVGILVLILTLVVIPAIGYLILAA